MNTSIYFIYFVALHRFADSVGTSAQEPEKPNMKKALFFDWKEKKILEINKMSDEDNCSSCLSACPASTHSAREQQIKDNISITGNAIFLQNVYEKINPEEKIRGNICEDPPTPAVIWDKIVKSYKIGYELFYEEGRIEPLKLYGYEDFMKVVKGEPIEATRDLRNNQLVKIYQEGRTTMFELTTEPGKKLVFYWIHVLWVDISESTNKRLIAFEKDRIDDYFNRRQAVSYCKGYYTGSEIEMDKKNKNETSTEILGEKLAEEDVQIQDENAEVEENHLVKTQILPMLMLHAHSTRISTCVYLNFAFVWQSIANEQLKKIDLFLYSLYRERPLIDISFGVGGQSTSITPDKLDEIASENEIFFKFPVPEIVYRHVVHPLPNGQLYQAIVVLHNDPNPISDTQRACSVQEEVKGWHDIKSTNTRGGFSYTCPPTKEVFRKVGLGERYYDNTSLTLELNNFPHLHSLTNQVYYEDVLDQVHKKMEYIKNLKNVD